MMSRRTSGGGNSLLLSLELTSLKNWLIVKRIYIYICVFIYIYIYINIYIYRKVQNIESSNTLVMKITITYQLNNRYVKWMLM